MPFLLCIDWLNLAGGAGAMFGILRLGLACLVAISHCGVLWFGLNPGVAAVVVFYLLAGFIMADQLQHYFPHWRDVPRFYRDRALRILPLYWAFMLLALGFVWLTGYQSGYMQAGISLSSLLQNLLVIPLNFYMVSHIGQATLLPPAWSLGAELQFYLVAPLLLLWRRGLLLGLVMGAGFFLAAAAGWLNTDVWGYRLLPGAILFFLTGAAIARKQWVLLGFVLGVALLGAALAFALNNWQAPYLRETLLGLLAGSLLITTLIRLPPHPWDIRLGYLAYGVFLSQFLAIWWFEMHPIAPKGSWPQVLAVLSVSLLLALLGYWLIDRPVAHWRRLHRRKASRSPS